MRLPKWEKVDFSLTDADSIHQFLKTLRIGEIPILLVLKMNDEIEVENALNHIQDYFNQSHIDPNIPYPFYIISPLARPHPTLNIIRTPQELPEHFWVKVKRLKGKEEALLKKTSVIAQKLRSHDLIKKREYVQNQFSLNKILRDLTREAYFYEAILQELKNKDYE